MNIKTSVYKIVNYSELWKNKINNIEFYFADNKDYIMDYFLGLSELSINYSSIIDYSLIKYGLCYSRVIHNSTLFDFWNPLMVKKGPLVNTFAEFIKYKFFDNHVCIDLINIFINDFSKNDYVLLISRLLFPTYYFDLLKDVNNNSININSIVNRVEDYVEFVKSIINEIKKRYFDIPSLDF